MRPEKDVFTTGDVARLCRVTIRTVIKWYDQGRLDGYRLPGSRERRFTRNSVERFMRAHDIPMEFIGEVRAAKRVLVVDDDEHIRNLVVRYLQTLGVLEVHSAASGWEAGLKIASLRPTVLLLDFRLGDTTGDKVVQTIRSMDDIPQPSIIIMSAHLSDEESADVLEHGADEVIRKPFELTALRDVVLRRAGLPA